MSHSAKPYGRNSGYFELDAADAAMVEHLIRGFTNLRGVLAQQNYRRFYKLPSGAVAVIQDMGGIPKVIVYPPEKQEEEHTGKAHVDVPMFFSGEALSTAVRYGADGNVMEGAQLALTQQCRRRLDGYTETLAPQRLRLHRFVIGYAPHFVEFVRPSGMKILQYAQLRPTWWSGRMAAVVQLAQGYGRHEFDKLPDAPYEKATLAVPEDVGAKMAAELGLDAEGGGGAILPACDGWPVKSGETQFDYKASRTDGVVFGTDGLPWLVRVSAQGVFAMPLPMVPATRTAAFRAWAEQVGDVEILWLLDTFGGMPSGEGFPVQEKEFAAWRRAGVIIRLGSASEFYALNAYSSATAWSFNTSGTQAVATGWKWGDDGLKRGQTWLLRFTIGHCLSGGMAKPPVPPADWQPSVQQRVLAYISAVEQAAGMNDKGAKDALKLAAVYALRRARWDDVYSRVVGERVSTPQAELEYWMDYEAQPIAMGWCSQFQMDSEGILWAPGEPKRQPQIKFPEPAADPQGCYSFDFGRLEGSAPPHPEPKSDTIMHAYFVGDDMKVVKYFRDTTEVAVGVERNYDEGDVLTVGTWEETIAYTPLGLQGNFYTTDFDEREWSATHFKYTKTTGKDLGYDAIPRFKQDYIFSTGGRIWRNRYVQYDVKSIEVKTQSSRVAICVPYYAPHAALHAWRWNHEGKTETTARSVGAIEDPNHYRYTTYHFVWAWSGSGSPANKENYTGPLEPNPMVRREGDPVWVIGYNYDPWMAGADFADQGDWMGGLPQDYTWLVHPGNEWLSEGGGTPPAIRQFHNTKHLPDEDGGSLSVSYAPQPLKILDTAPDIMYFAPSPDDYGNVFYRDATRNEAGDEYGNVSESRQGERERFHWGWNEVADNQSAHHFIGVLKT